LDDRIRSMEKIFSPRSIAFIGASNSIGKWGGIIFGNLVGGGYKGKIYPVNHACGVKLIQKHRAYRSVSDIPGEVDLAIFTIPAAVIPEAISECVKKGIKAGIVITAGFAELGDDGATLQKEMVKRARAGGMVLIGPNGQGISVPSRNLHPWMPIFKPDPGGIGIASQSGNVCTVLAECLAEFGFGCSKAISSGNCADLAWADYLEYFRQDPETKVVLLYIEGLDNGREFLDAAKKCALEKPVVLLKSGRTAAGSSAAASHTGVMAGLDDVFTASCRQAGLVRAETIEDAVFAAATFINTPLPKGRRVGIITGGGGYGVIAADAASKIGLDLVKFSDGTIEQIRRHLPPWWAPNNPVDMVAGLGYGGPRELIPILMESGEVDGVILLGVGWFYHMVDAVNSKVDLFNLKDEILIKRQEHEVKYTDLLAEYSKKWEKPLLMTSNSARLAIRHGYAGLVNLLKRNIMLYPDIEDAIKAYSVLADRYHFLEREAVSAKF